MLKSRASILVERMSRVVNHNKHNIPLKTETSRWNIKKRWQKYIDESIDKRGLHEDWEYLYHLEKTNNL